VEKYQVFVYRIGTLLNKSWNNSGSEYKASLNNKYFNKLAIFLSMIENGDCVLEIYQDYKVQK